MAVISEWVIGTVVPESVIIAIVSKGVRATAASEWSRATVIPEGI